jgi:glycerol uptake facilitator-like aquaporin
MLRSGLKAPSSIKANGFADQYKDANTSSAWLWAPTHLKESRLSLRTQIKSYLMELVATCIFVFCLGFSVVTAANNGTDMALRSLTVAIVAFGSYMMVTGWLRLPEEELPRLAMWNLTLSRLVTLRLGLFHALFYVVAQFLGMILGACLLVAFGTGATSEHVYIPSYSGNLVASWAAELFGSSFIVMAYLYNSMSGVEHEKEHEHQRDGEMAAALVRGIFTLLFFRLGHWTFDPVVYLAGLFAAAFSTNPTTWLSDTNMTRLSAGFFLGAPLIGMVIGVAVYLFLLFLSYHGDDDKKRIAKGAKLVHSVDGRITHTQYTKMNE